MINKAIIDGEKIKEEKDFYLQIAEQIDFGFGFGYNYHAFIDRLGRDLEGPICIVWRNHEHSKEILGDKFFMITNALEKIKKDDEKYLPEGKRFTYQLE